MSTRLKSIDAAHSGSLRSHDTCVVSRPSLRLMPQAPARALCWTTIDPVAVSVSAMKTAKFIYITDENKDLFLSDNFFDLNAGEQKVIQVLNINKEKLNMNNLTIISLYDILSTDNTADLKN